jgi:hypothetical protein
VNASVEFFEIIFRAAFRDRLQAAGTLINKAATRAGWSIRAE